MKVIKSMAATAAFVGLVVVLLAAPAQARSRGELIERTRRAKVQYEYWKVEHHRLQRQLNRLHYRISKVQRAAPKQARIIQRNSQRNDHRPRYNRTRNPETDFGIGFFDRETGVRIFIGSGH